MSEKSGRAKKDVTREKKNTETYLKKIFDRRLNHMIVMALSASTDESDRVILKSN